MKAVEMVRACAVVLRTGEMVIISDTESGIRYIMQGLNAIGEVSIFDIE